MDPMYWQWADLFTLVSSQYLWQVLIKPLRPAMQPYAGLRSHILHTIDHRCQGKVHKR